nr:immunoglobulin heavy chain junction region [Mus musculus]
CAREEYDYFYYAMDYW